MAENSGIEWTDHTFNPWIGCDKVSPACDNCYAERVAARMQVVWGPKEARKRTSPTNWNEPVRWNRRAEQTGVRERVFCASLADVFDNKVDPAWRRDLFDLIEATPMLDWLLLTKRIGNVASMIQTPRDVQIMRERVWLGISVVTQAEADRDIPKLQDAPAALRFLSLEPLISAVSLSPISRQSMDRDWTYADYPLEGLTSTKAGHWSVPKIDWVIAGGESGPKARPSHPGWFRKLRDQCQKAGVPFFFKQWGEFEPVEMEASGMNEVVPGELLAHPGGRLTAYTPSDDRSLFVMRRTGKKAAGSSLDGVQHKGTP